MPKKPGPSLLCEWMVGTTIKSALGSPPKAQKPKQTKRDVIKLHVTTDDESGEDTLTVTYPRRERPREKEAEAPVSEPEPEFEPKPVPTPEPKPDPQPEGKPEVVEVVKKVRFQKEATPVKSAMKKKTSVTFCEEEETTSESSVDASSNPGSSGQATPEASSSNGSSDGETSSAGESSSDSSSVAAKPSKPKKLTKKKKEKLVQSSESEADSEPHPTCECKECALARKKKQGTACEKSKCKKKGKHAVHKKQEPESESEPETSASEAQSSTDEKPMPTKTSNRKKKGAKIVEISSNEGETSESAKESETESEVIVRITAGKKKLDTTSRKSGKKANNSKEEGKEKPQDKKEPEEAKKAEETKKAEEEKKTEEAEPEKTSTDKGKEKGVDEPQKPAAVDGQKMHQPGGYQYPHSRPPNLIAPIRSELMQTERVVETQDDPPPNAYYDALHGVVRVYHGSVYGQNGHHMFAARENAAGPPHPASMPHPAGMPHPAQNPYYPGYNNVMPMPPPQQQQPPQGYEHVPITQGMSMPSWNAMVPPPGYPPYAYPVPPPMPAPWYENPYNKQGYRSAFSMSNSAGGTPDRKKGSKAPEPNNNVMPEPAKVDTTREKVLRFVDHDSANTDLVKPNPYYKKRQSPFSNMGSNRSNGNDKPPSHSGNSNCSKNSGGSQQGQDGAGNWDAFSRRSVGAWANRSDQGAPWGGSGNGSATNNNNNNNHGGCDQWGTGGGGNDTWNTTNNGNNTWGTTNNGDTWGTNNGDTWGTTTDNNNNDAWGTTNNNNQWNSTGARQWGTGSGNEKNNQGTWGNSDNANNGGTWGDSNANNQQQTNDNSGNDGGGQGQDQGQKTSPTGGKDPTPAMVDNNVIPSSAVTGPPGEHEQSSKMPGSWCSDDNGQAAFVDPTWSSYQPPSAVPEWADPSMAASTGGQADLW
ncbi:hypothetical protein MKX07_004292 [Trichoderma sp. CBMAI-0711]|uniref:Uncharacterized protein n=1 Tax=Trichoderma parareesei TaxID=858221 RepID=A0A2H2Z6Z7_TRIPA|nr:hypothetical protein MKX07_004292 [Trichoderma sp. CBMAI-0711]OTA03777.1 hypothetical protein A9Z42_0042600 [Trichoderma parareesei]